MVDPSPEQVLQDLSHDLMSPFCPGRTIASCPSQQARRLEDQIYAKAKAGKTRREIEQELVARYGEEIVGYRGDPAVVWGSFSVALGALVLVGLAVRRWVRRARRGEAVVASEPCPPLSERDRERLEDALDDIPAF